MASHGGFVQGDGTDVRSDVSAVKLNVNELQKAQDMADHLDARVFIAYVRLMDTLEGAAEADLFNEQKSGWESR